eukprot:10225548-Ditylum_brightwellii.AAC.1
MAVDLNPSFGSHSLRKYTMQMLAKTFDVSPHMINFCVGIIMYNINSFFDYVFNSDNIDKQTGKRIDGWDFALDNEIYGGYSPTLDDISTERHKLDDFIECLLGKQTKVDMKAKKLLIASLLR